MASFPEPSTRCISSDHPNDPDSNDLDSTTFMVREVAIDAREGFGEGVEMKHVVLGTQEGPGVDCGSGELELRVGDSLRRKIDAGISRSRFGVVILSPHFFAKGWPNYELDGLVTLSVSGRQIFLPIWHGVSAEEVAKFSPSLAHRVALGTDRLSISEIADEISVVAVSNHGENG